MSGRRSPGWRDRAASDLVLRHLDVIDPSGPSLVVDDPRDAVVDALRGRPAVGDEGVRRWDRRAVGGRPAAPWPPPGELRSCFLRLSRAKEELAMAVHAVASRLAPGGRLIVYGARDEGAASAPRVLEPLFDHVHTVATGGRCRLVSGLRKAPDAVGAGVLRATLASWRIEIEPPHPELDSGRWVSYPGVFAAGRLDAGTALLLEVAPRARTGDRVLDFGCGDGVVAGVTAARTPGLRPVMVDVDAVALVAARENVPTGRPVLGDGWTHWGPAPAGDRRAGSSASTADDGDAGPAVGVPDRFDLVLSNPPYHAGKAETTETVDALVRGAARQLERGGRLAFVVQRRLPVEELLARTPGFRRVEVLADRGPYRVWLAVRR